jgi:hypothetical protein
MESFSYPDADGFGGFGPFLSGLTIFTLAIYFITSSDSGSLVVDILASNGQTKHHWIQRVFWSFTEGGKLCEFQTFCQDLLLVSCSQTIHIFCSPSLL